ncbi:MAG TPA: alpha/beta fold hydrolase [Gemmatimonadaceae bacterium]|nr:alpha/beta fold hydrolase [Gemmatimonadaceae bacterium]
MIALLPNGLKIAYDEAGSGTPLLLVHGWPHDRTLWSGQLGGLATYARVLAPDLRGTGGSTVRGPYTIDQYADDLIGFLDSLGIARAVVCGLSMGGYIAFSMLRRHRDRIRGLVLADTRATADTDEGRANRAKTIASIEQEGMTALAERQLPSMLGRSTIERHPPLVDTVRRMMASVPPEGAIGALRAMADRPDSTPLLATIDVPTLVVVGAEDTITTPEVVRGMAASIRKSRVEILEQSGHLCPLERSAAFNHIVGEFLGTLLYH